MNPKFTFAYFNRGIAYYSKKEYDLAISDYDQAIALNSNFPDAYLKKGLAYFGKKDYDDAIAEYTKALELSPKFADTNYKRAFIMNPKNWTGG